MGGQGGEEGGPDDQKSDPPPRDQQLFLLLFPPTTEKGDMTTILSYPRKRRYNPKKFSTANRHLERPEAKKCLGKPINKVQQPSSAAKIS